MRSSEVELLETFQKCLNLSNKIGSTENQRCYRVQFSNVQLYNWLLKIGLFPAKTYTIGKIKIPDEFFRDFVRGHLDGDGNIRYYEDNYNLYKNRKYLNLRLFIKFVSASENHIRWLNKKISELANLKGAMFASKPSLANRVPLWQIKFSKKESIKLLNWVYYKNNLPCLKRKRVIAEKAVRNIVNEKRKVYTRIPVPSTVF